jgi:hypothetical protein
MRDRRLLFLVIGLLVGGLLISCASVPSPGHHIVVQVVNVPGQRQQLQLHPGLSLALKRGVTRDEVKAGRLLSAGCYDEDQAHLKGTARRHGFVLIPDGVNVAAGDIIELAAEEADGKPLAYARFYGHYLKLAEAKDSDYFPYQYAVSGRAFRCGAVTPEGVMRLEVYSAVQYWDYDAAEAEELRNAQIQDSELEQGRVVIAECSPGVDSWLFWKVRLPTGLNVRAGDYIEVIAGANEAPRSRGLLSEAVRKVEAPDQTHFVQTQGRMTVACDALVGAGN